MKNSRHADGGKLLAARSAAFFERTNDVDLSRLDDSELALLERLLLKASGQLDGDVIPQFRIERVFVDTGEPTDDANYVER
jgi:hypothetical protein